MRALGSRMRSLRSASANRTRGSAAALAGIDVQFHGRFNEQYSRLDACFDRLDRILCLNTWMLVIIILVLVVPQLWAWSAWWRE